MSRVLLVAWKQLVEIARQPRNLALLLGLPLAFMAVFGFAFGGGAANAPLDVAVADQDGGPLATEYVLGLEALAYDDGTPMLRVARVADPEEARADLGSRDVAALLVVPRGFSEGLTPTTQPGATPLQPAQTAPPSGSSVRLVGDPSFPGYGAVAAIVEGYSLGFAAEATRSPPALVVEREAATSSALEDFDFIAPGLMVFAILNLAPQASAMLARESEQGTLDRLRQSPVGAVRLLAGVALAQLVLASVSMALMLLMAQAMGFHNQGTFLEAYAILMLAALAVVGAGMVIASLARTQQEAANVGILFSVPASFLSGAFFPLPPLDLFTVDGHVVGVYHALPTTWAVVALRQVLTFGRPLSDVAFELGALAVLGLLFLAAGAWLFRRNRLAPA